MVQFDVFLIVLWILSIIYGWFQGISKAMSSGLSGLISSLYIAFLFLAPFKEFLIYFEAHAWVVSFALPILTTIILLFLKSIGSILKQVTERTHTKFIDDIFGAFWGVVRGAAIIKFIFWIVAYAGMHKLKDASLIYPWFSSIVQIF